MQSDDKESKRQYRIAEENRRLDEAAKKKQKRQLEEINRLEWVARKEIKKEKKLQCDYSNSENQVLYSQQFIHQNEIKRSSGDYNQSQIISFYQIEEENQKLHEAVLKKQK